MFKKVLLFCFCAIIIAAIIPFGVSYWSEDILIRGSITMPEEKGTMSLPEIGGANSNYKGSGTEGEKSPLFKDNSADGSRESSDSTLNTNDANPDRDNFIPDSPTSPLSSESGSTSFGDSSAGGHAGSAETSATSSSGESSTSGAAGDE